MGACTFQNSARRLGRQDGYVEEMIGGTKILKSCYVEWASPQQAFDHLVDEDRYENGHSYSGGIGMKHEFRMAGKVKTMTEAKALVNAFFDKDDPRFCEKYGPCGCIEIEEGDYAYLFFGWAAC